MALSASVGQFTIASGTATGTQAITGLGFTPKIVFLWGGTTGVLTTGASAGKFLANSFGTAVSGGNIWSHYEYLGIGTTQTSSVAGSANTTSYAHYCISPAGGNIDILNVSSWDVDGFTIQRLVVTPSGSTINWLALGGAALTAAVVTTSSAKSGTTDYTGSGGPGFTPSAVMFWQGYDYFNGAMVGLGFVSSGSTNGHAAMFNERDGSATRIGNSLMFQTATVDHYGYNKGYLSAWLPTGFTLSWSQSVGSQNTLTYAALSGGNFAAGFLPMSGTTVALTGLSFSPKAVLIQSIGWMSMYDPSAPTQWPQNQDFIWSLGAAASASNGQCCTELSCIYHIIRPNISASMLNTTGSIVTVHRQYASGWMLDAAYSWVSATADGFVLSGSVVPPIPYQMAYLCMG